MSKEISPLRSALDSLLRLVKGLDGLQSDDPFALKEPVLWGWHAVGLLAYLRLQPARHTFDAWIQDYLHEGSLELNVERDAHWEERERLSLLELIDLLSQADLPSLKPEFYQGWQDRTVRCRNLRAKVEKVIGRSLDEEHRQDLLLLLAAYHRLIRLPAGVIVEADQVIKAFPALFDLIEMLIDKNGTKVDLLTDALAKCRQALPSS